MCVKVTRIIDLPYHVFEREPFPRVINSSNITSADVTKDFFLVQMLHRGHYFPCFLVSKLNFA